MTYGSRPKWDKIREIDLKNRNYCFIITIVRLRAKFKAFMLNRRKSKIIPENMCQEKNAIVYKFFEGLYPLIRPSGHLLPEGEGPLAKSQS